MPIITATETIKATGIAITKVYDSDSKNDIDINIVIVIIIDIDNDNTKNSNNSCNHNIADINFQ